MPNCQAPLKPLLFSVFASARADGKGNEPRRHPTALWMHAGVAEWDDDMARDFCERGGQSTGAGVTDDLVMKAALALAARVAQDMAATGHFKNFDIQHRESIPAFGHKGHVASVDILCKTDRESIYDLQPFCVELFLDLFGGAAEIHLEEFGHADGQYSRVLTAGAHGTDEPALAEGSPVRVELSVRGDAALSGVTFEAGSPTLVELIRLMPPERQATPGNRRDCALALIELEAGLAMKSLTPCDFEIRMEDRSDARADRSIIVHCDVDESSGATSQALADRLLLSETGLFI